jgi:RNA polymerase sigma-70 factor (ECF subfamily)
MNDGAGSYHRFLSGDLSGLKDLINEYYNDLVLYLNRYIGNMQDAEDMAEETFFVISTKRPSFRGDSAFKTWLFSIGRNCTLNHLRKTNREVLTPAEDMEVLAGTHPDVLDEMILAEERDKLHRALQKLPEDYRKALLFRYFEDMSAKDIALAMNKTVLGVNGIIKRAKTALKDLLKEEKHERP